MVYIYIYVCVYVYVCVWQQVCDLNVLLPCKHTSMGLQPHTYVTIFKVTLQPHVLPSSPGLYISLSLHRDYAIVWPSTVVHHLVCIHLRQSAEETTGNCT